MEGSGKINVTFYHALLIISRRRSAKAINNVQNSDQWLASLSDASLPYRHFTPPKAPWRTVIFLLYLYLVFIHRYLYFSLIWNGLLRGKAELAEMQSVRAPGQFSAR